MNWKEEKDTLYNLIIVEKKSYTEIGKIYGCSDSNIRKVAKRLGIELEQRRKINEKETFGRGSGKKGICPNCGNEFTISDNKKFCCFECSAEYKHKENYKKFLNGGEEYMTASYNPKIFKKDIIEEQGGVCSICGCEQEHNGKPLIFILDHIDGHAANNKRENLRCICPNCDSQLETYKYRNIKVVGSGDRYFLRYGKQK